jgi:hypothetical protein
VVVTTIGSGSVVTVVGGAVLVTGAGGGAVLVTVVVGPGTTRVVSTTRVFGTGAGTGTGTGVATTPGDDWAIYSFEDRRIRGRMLARR